MVEHVIGNDGVSSSILLGGTIDPGLAVLRALVEWRRSFYAFRVLDQALARTYLDRLHHKR